MLPRQYLRNRQCLRALSSAASGSVRIRGMSLHPLGCACGPSDAGRTCTRSSPRSPSSSGHPQCQGVCALAPGDVGGVQPHCPELVPPVCHPHVHVPASSAECDGLDPLFAVPVPQNASDDRHRGAPVDALALGAGVVPDDRTASQPGCGRGMNTAIAGRINYTFDHRQRLLAFLGSV
jgi:hypothetical protein